MIRIGNALLSTRTALLKRSSEFRMHRAAGTALLIRVAGAGIAFLSQPLLARWMGGYEFGVYAYVLTWVLLFGSFIDFGFAPTHSGLFRNILYLKTLICSGD